MEPANFRATIRRAFFIVDAQRRIVVIRPRCRSQLLLARDSACRRR
jgi:hypothetical protein